jgi:hypothetical protein
VIATSKKVAFIIPVVIANVALVAAGNLFRAGASSKNTPMIHAMADAVSRSSLGV